MATTVSSESVCVCYARRHISHSITGVIHLKKVKIWKEKWKLHCELIYVYPAYAALALKQTNKQKNLINELAYLCIRLLLTTQKKDTSSEHKSNQPSCKLLMRVSCDPDDQSSKFQPPLLYNHNITWPLQLCMCAYMQVLHLSLSSTTLQCTSVSLQLFKRAVCVCLYKHSTSILKLVQRCS